jgi:hypothetical protein
MFVFKQNETEFYFLKTIFTYYSVDIFLNFFNGKNRKVYGTFESDFFPSMNTTHIYLLL